MRALGLCCRFMRYLPKMVKHAKEVFLTYIAPVHYNTIKCASVDARSSSVNLKTCCSLLLHLHCEYLALPAQSLAYRLLVRPFVCQLGLSTSCSAFT